MLASLKGFTLRYGFLWALALLTACAPAGFANPPLSAGSNWLPGNLRWVQGFDESPLPQIIAVYTRETGFDLEIRCDFVELNQPADFDFYLALDSRSGGTSRLPIEASGDLSWDTLVKVPASGPALAYDPGLVPRANLVPRVIDDPRQAARVIQLNRSSLPGNPSQVALQVFLTPLGQGNVIHQTPRVSSGTVARRAPLLLVFWDSLPAATPAQALRRWDGAHTGPLGGRHGLSVLLQAAGENHVPLVLADLKRPASLAGLAVLGRLHLLQQAELSANLLLPEITQSSPGQASSPSWNLLESPYRFAPLTPGDTPCSQAAFGVLADPRHIQLWRNCRLVPLPSAPTAPPSPEEPSQVGTTGLAYPVLRSLLNTALSPDPAALVVLGGSLPTSAWGDFSVAPRVFEYIAKHPWIWPLDGSDLLNFPAQPAASWPGAPGCGDLLCGPAPAAVTPYTSQGQPVPSGLNSLEIKSRLEQQLAGLPRSSFTIQAQEMISRLTVASPDATLNALRANYLGQAGYLLEAARWARQPRSLADCASDLDWDGNPECRLASEHWLAIIKTDGARLVFAASRDSEGASQWVGPLSQFAAGLSDPSTWQPRLGPAADPDEIPGGFALEGRPFEPYRVDIQNSSIQFRSIRDDQVTYTLAGSSLHVAIRASQVTATRLPITLAPQAWPSAQPVENWLPAPRLEAGRWTWAPSRGNGLNIEFEGAGQLSSISFLDSLDLLKGSEDPNRAYPRGHFVPFPMAVINIQGSSFQVRFTAPGN